jgi:hypothetical protein
LRKKDLSCFPRQLKLFLGDMIVSLGKKGLSYSPWQLKFLGEKKGLNRSTRQLKLLFFNGKKGLSCSPR